MVSLMVIWLMVLTHNICSYGHLAWYVPEGHLFCSRTLRLTAFFVVAPCTLQPNQARQRQHPQNLALTLVAREKSAFCQHPPDAFKWPRNDFQTRPRTFLCPASSKWLILALNEKSQASKNCAKILLK